MDKKVYTEEEARTLAGNIASDIGFYIVACVMTKQDSKTGEKFDELFEKYKKKEE